MINLISPIVNICTHMRHVPADLDLLLLVASGLEVVQAVIVPLPAPVDPLVLALLGVVHGDRLGLGLGLHLLVLVHAHLDLLDAFLCREGFDCIWNRDSSSQLAFICRLRAQLCLSDMNRCYVPRNTHTADFVIYRVNDITLLVNLISC